MNVAIAATGSRAVQVIHVQAPSYCAAEASGVFQAVRPPEAAKNQPSHQATKTITPVTRNRLTAMP